ncbi:bifunctional demethylmenaquinone methyltransferase/2-methoxy-6-polyprenyl-1,4-benzoquinol methylase UbiE [Bythopirellula polymerisocia]|uniref:Demethylmenaquinone methyltransferase n=1 Tax=Bythopirellula polymerisocia TaxID=2528003 RepID=A0A5C6CTC7_9BACT|nr:bifunctional demethylmenaquinone methyltransferase/2-methoxy-6-polyprenyl-1,4-benzoquinol methylase UbiE [Bythopirellula polymerisocia]TWU27850.1 UbiE/COQ5 methyltransferase [Bythopirellula polymerisocia]
MATVDKSGERVREMFGEIAGRYDFLNHLLSLNIDRYWRWRTVRAVPPHPGAKILDLCTGTGDLAFAYNKAAHGEAQIIGADFCLPMLVIGREKGKKSDGAGVTFLEADAQQIPLEENQFDIVSVAFGLRNVADTDLGLSEMVRVCAPGGKVTVLEFSTPRWQPFGAIYGWYFRYVLPKIGQLFARNSHAAYNYLPTSVSQFPQGEELAERMRAAGLVDVGFRGLTLGVTTLYVGTKPSIEK